MHLVGPSLARRSLEPGGWNGGVDYFSDPSSWPLRTDLCASFSEGARRTRTQVVRRWAHAEGGSHRRTGLRGEDRLSPLGPHLGHHGFRPGHR